MKTIKMNEIIEFVSRIIKHSKTVFVHKWWVFRYCCMCGIPWRGFMHDWSKFSPEEFIESIKFYTPGESPIPIAKKAQGWSKAWQHHKHHNKHHYEYWTDNYDTGMTCIRIPFKYVVEMICDWLAAGKAYSGNRFTFDLELKWWESKKDTIKIHPDIKVFISDVFNKLSKYEKIGWPIDLILHKQSLKILYLMSINVDNPENIKI